MIQKRSIHTARGANSFPCSEAPASEHTATVAPASQGELWRREPPGHGAPGLEPWNETDLCSGSFVFYGDSFTTLRRRCFPALRFLLFVLICR